ncbi:MAG: AMP-binding protein, partial [Gemmatimonadetes bacterium]|nr:AMP-binding protein [Gemmatimonadota bacterium]
MNAGLPYVPLEPYSPAILEQVLARASLGVLVTSRRFAPVLAASLPEDLPRIWIGEESPPESPAEPFPEPDPLRIAHLAFTSGTRTGIPRMVATDHVGSMLSHAWRCRLWPFDPARDVVGCNIFGIWDVVPALCRGVPAVLIRDETMRDPFALASAIVRFGITRIMMTPTLLGACLDCGEGIEALRRLRLLVLCGETAAPAIVQGAWEALPGVRVANLYSTAECHDIAGGVLMPGKAVTCGVVADFAEVHLCHPDDPHRLVEVGSPGRVLVGGSALARAVHSADGGEGGFVEVDLPAPGGGCRRTRVWDTGDLGVFHPGGELEILGRCDSGLKIRGSWVEPGEIEGALEQHPLVRRACVTAETDPRGQTELVAYVVPGQEGQHAATLAGRLRDFAASRLPRQSVPGRFVPVDELPLLPSGKVDRRRLRLAEPALAVSRVEASSEPGDLREQVLAAFRETLDDPAIGLGDDFETSGGHSLRAIRLCGILHGATGRRVAVGDLYRHPTPSGLTRFLREQKGLHRPPKWSPPELEIDTPAPELPEPRIPPRTVLVTGATGFLGAALVETLLRGTSVKVVALVRAGDIRGARRRLEEALGQHGGAGLLRRNPDSGSQEITGDHGSAEPGSAGSGGGAEHLQEIQEDIPKAGSV